MGTPFCAMHSVGAWCLVQSSALDACRFPSVIQGDCRISSMEPYFNTWICHACSLFLNPCIFDKLSLAQGTDGEGYIEIR